MIVVDIETSGLDCQKCGIWQIGALDFYNPSDIFLEEARIDEEDIVEEGAMKICGLKKEQYKDKSKQSQKQLLIRFFKWTEDKKIKTIICQNPQFDWSFITLKANKYGLKVPFHHRTLDLHSIAALRYFQVNSKFLIKEGHSDMGLSTILKFCGVEDPRIKLDGNTLLKKGKPHNALEDCKLEAECFSRLIYKKSLLSEYSKFKLPDYLD